MKRPGEKGQTLLELVIVLPLFAALLLATALWADLVLKKLDLIQLTRNFAVMLARDDQSRYRSPKDLENQMRILAQKTSRLDDRHLSFHLAPLPPTLRQDADPAAAEALSLPGVGGMLQSMLLGERLQLSYRMEFRGLLGKALPHGIELKETVALKRDPWTNIGERLLHMLGL